MKKNFTLVLTVCALLGQSTSLFAQKHHLGKFKLEELVKKDDDANGKTKLQSIREAMEWRNSLLIDENGTFQPEYYLDAVKRADQLKAAASQRSASLQWEELGPGNVGGRTRAIIYDKRDATRLTIYAGSVGGGLWKSIDGGNNWSRITSVHSNMAICSMAQDANGVIYFGTGEGLSQPSGTSRNSGTVGNGLHMLYGSDQDSILPSTVPSSISNGVMWCEINRIAINPNNVMDMFVAISGNNNTGGLMHSTDGGQSWIVVGSNASPITNLSSGYNQAADVKFSSDGSFVFASVGMGGGISPGGRFIMSSDGGITWLAVPTGNFPQYPTSGVRIEIAPAPSNPNVVYFTLAASSSGTLAYVYKSADAGSSWTLIGSPGGVLNAPFGADGQGWYDNVLAVNPFDEDKLYLGGTQLYTYTSLSGWALASIYFGDPSIPQWVHADMHAIVFNDHNRDEMLVGCDGGIFKSTNAFTNFPTPDYTEKNRGYAVTQNYSVAADVNGSVVGGAQDNGTNYVNYLNGATTYSTNVYGGDGVYAEISHFDPNIFIGGYVNGNDYRSSTKGSAWVSPFDGVIDPKGFVEPSVCGQAKGAGNAPFVTSFWLVESNKAFNSIDSVSYSDTTAHYAGETLTLTGRIKQKFQVTLTDSISKNDTVRFVDPLNSRLYFASSCGLWVTPDILDFSNTPRWFRMTASSDDVKSLTATPTGDTIYFAGNAKMHRMIGMNSILAFDTALKGHNDVVLSSGRRYRDTLIQVTSSSGRYIEGMDVDKNDPTHVLAAVAGYSSSGLPHVYQSFNSGNTWTGVGVNSLPNMPVYQCVIDYYNPSHYIVGTELGVWDSYDNGTTWTEQNSGIDARLPVYRVRQQNYLSENCYALYLGTHGRGMWRCTTLTSASPDGCVVNALGINTTPKNAINSMMVYPNPITSGTTKVSIEVSQPTDMTIRVIDMPGRLLQETSFSNLTSGKNELNLNTSNLSNGTYLVVGTLANGQTMTRTISVVR